MRFYNNAAKKFGIDNWQCRIMPEVVPNIPKISVRHIVKMYN